MVFTGSGKSSYLWSSEYKEQYEQVVALLQEKKRAKREGTSPSRESCIYSHHKHCFSFTSSLFHPFSSSTKIIQVITTYSHGQFPKVSCINLFISHARTGKAYPSSGNENTEHRMAGLFRWGESRDGYKNIYLQVNAEATNDALLKWWQKSSRMPFTIERLYSMSQSIYPYAIASLAV